MIRGTDDIFINTYDGLVPSSNNDGMIKFGSVDDINEIISIIMTRKIITNVLIKLNLKNV